MRRSRAAPRSSSTSARWGTSNELAADGGPDAARGPKVYPFADSQSAVAQVRAEGIIKTTGRIYRQEYVVFLRAANGKIVFIREYFDPLLVRPRRSIRRFSIRTLVTSSNFRKINRSSEFKEL